MKKRGGIKMRPVEGRQTVESRSETRHNRERPGPIGERYQTDADSAGRQEMPVLKIKRPEPGLWLCPVCHYSTTANVDRCPKCGLFGMVGPEEE